jgi:peroxiredoxin
MQQTTRGQFLATLTGGALGLTGLAISGALTSCSPEASSSNVDLKPEVDRNQAPDFTLDDANGQPVTLSEFRGKVVLLNFWATWCTPCRIEIPWFVDMEREFKDEGFAVIGVSMDEDGWEVVKPFMDNLKVNYRMVLGTEELAQLYSGVQALPTSFIIDRDGRIATTHAGIVSRKTFEEEIRALLDNKGSASAAGVDGSKLPLRAGR